MENELFAQIIGSKKTRSTRDSLKHKQKEGIFQLKITYCYKKNQWNSVSDSSLPSGWLFRKGKANELIFAILFDYLD